MSFRTCFAEDFDIHDVPKAWLEAPRVSFRTCFAEDFDIPGAQKAWLEAPRVSFHACFAGDFDNFGVQKALLEAPRVSFRTCFTRDFDNADAKTGMWAGWDFGIFAGLPGSPDLSSKPNSGDDFCPIVGAPLYVDPHGLKFWHPKRHSTRVLPRMLRILTFGKLILRPPGIIPHAFYRGFWQLRLPKTKLTDPQDVIPHVFCRGF